MTTTLLKVELATGPWHRLGFHLATDYQNTHLNEALRLGGLDWEARVEPLYLRGGKRLTNRSAITRSDNRAVLAVVGSQYRPIQHRDAASVLDDIWGERAMYTSAGSVSGGRRYWFLAEQRQLKWHGMVGQILLTGGHDSSAVVRMRLAVLRGADLTLLPGPRLPDPGLSHGRRARALPRNWATVVENEWNGLVTQYEVLRAAGLHAHTFRGLVELVTGKSRMGRVRQEELVELYRGQEQTGLGALVAVCLHFDQERTRYSAPRSLRAADESALLGRWAQEKEVWMNILLNYVRSEV